MKHLLFSAKVINKDENYKGFILAREGKAQVYPIKFRNFMGTLKVRGIFIGTCFNKKEIFK